MTRRCLIFALSFLTGFAYCQGQVFVDLNRLASLHPAWSIAERLLGERAKVTKIEPSPQFVSLTEVPLSLPLLKLTPFVEWATEQRRAWESELNLLKRRQHQIASWQLQLAIPPIPLIDPIARWKFIVEQRERQATERVRLNLRLAFSDLLPAEEREALRRRQRELDAALEPPSTSLPPIFLPISPAQQPDLPVPQNLTDPQEILSLVSPLPLPPQQSSVPHAIVEATDLTPKLLTANVGAVLRLMAYEAARAFARAYARGKGWKVTFDRKSGATDVTDEVLLAWKRWLESIKPKE
ncbi:hypothetical protein [Fervidibacter sp.]|jgi:hypothetical protein